MLDDRAGAAWGVVAGAFLLLGRVGTDAGAAHAWGIVLLGALLAAGVVALRRQILREFPDAGQEPPPHVSQAAEPAPAGNAGNGGAVPSGA